jgi:peptidoglycan hydrolase CwlO-like protein
MKDWIEKRIKEQNANNIIIFPLREEDVERRIRNAKMDIETLKNHEELLVSLERERKMFQNELSRQETMSERVEVRKDLKKCEEKIKELTEQIKKRKTKWNPEQKP